MKFTNWLNKLFKTSTIDSETEEFMEEAEKIKPEKPLDYENEPEEIGVTKEGSDL